MGLVTVIVELKNFVIERVTNVVDSELSWLALLFIVLIIPILIKTGVGYDYVNIEDQKRERPFTQIYKNIKQIYSTASVRMDLLHLILNQLIFVGIAQFIVLPLTAEYYSATFAPQISAFFGKIGLPKLNVIENHHAVHFIYLVIVFLAYEFFQYLCHFLKHRVGFLWEFHKVHHSAPFLAVTTAYRRHVVDIYTNIFFAGFAIGLTDAVFSQLFYSRPTYSLAADLRVVSLIITLSSSLDHSHIWWSWGKLERVLVSPAVHILHHSKDPKHFGKNLGETLSIFDHVFGTFAKPDVAPEGVEVGLVDKFDWSQASYFRTLIQPFKAITGIISAKGLKSIFKNVNEINLIGNFQKKL